MERGPYSNHPRSVIDSSQNPCQGLLNTVGRSDIVTHSGIIIQSGMGALNPCSGPTVNNVNQEMLICGGNDQVWDNSRCSKGVETSGNWQSLEVDLNAPSNSFANNLSPNSFANSFSPNSFSPNSFSQSSSHGTNSGRTFSGTNSLFSSTFTGSHETQNNKRDGGPWPWDNDNNNSNDPKSNYDVESKRNDVESKRNDVDSATSFGLPKEVEDRGRSSLPSYSSSSHNSQSSHLPSHPTRFPVYPQPTPSYSHYSQQNSQPSPVTPIVHFSETEQKPYYPHAQEWSVWRSGEQSKRSYQHNSQDIKSPFASLSTPSTPSTPSYTSPSPWRYGVEGGVESWEPPVNANIDQTGFDFLSICNYCQVSLDHHDIFMYGGERAFCSQDCRQKEILRDERSAHYATAGRRFPMVPSVTTEKPKRGERDWGLFIGTAVVAS